jgi:multidrug efflux system outer membrane protein
MNKINKYINMSLLGICLAAISCKIPAITQSLENRNVPNAYVNSLDSTNLAQEQWRIFFADKNLANLIDIALKNNQELNITLQEIEIAKNDIRFRQGQFLPSVMARGGIGLEKVGRYTSQGAGDASAEIIPGKLVPENLSDFTGAIYANWEIDVWKKLRNAKKAAVTRYLASIEGKNFVLSSLVAEVANSYYELLALDNQLAIVKQTIELQKNAFEIVKMQKDAARVTELAVQKFKAEVLNSQSLEFEILQNIKVTENKVNFLLGRFPSEITRTNTDFFALIPRQIQAGIPSQLLANRPDIKKAELELAAAKLDVKVARAEFYPSVGISAALGLQAFKPSYLLTLPESMLYSLAGDLAAPIVNRNGIQAEFKSANDRQIQAMYNYEQTILNGYLEVSNQLSNIDNLEKSYNLKSQEVAALNQSITIANDLFKSSRADYLEVLMTQRDALASKLELVETKKNQLMVVTNIYKELGGGWQ